jgi:radical SAM superfamily enzyme YgiQ (UPF0313 family)
LRVLLLHPPKTHQVWAGVPKVFNDKYAYLFPPLAVMYLSSWLKQYTNHTIEVIDGVVDDLEFSEVGARAKAFAPDVVGVSATATHNMINIVRSIDAIKKTCPHAKIVMGGPHVNSFPEASVKLRGVDAAICGDGEVPLTRLLNTLESGGDLRNVPNIILANEDGSVYQSEKLPNIEDLDEFPFPDRDACPPGKYFTPGMKGALATTMISSRGCPNRCVFCNVPTGYRTRSAENIVDEMQICAEKYHVQDIHFIDDLFNRTPERVNEISEEILRRGVKIWWGYKASIRNTNREMIRLAKRAGCYRMHYGVETYTEEGLRELKKKVTVPEIKEIFRMTQSEGVKAIAYMIIGNPHEKTAEEIMGVADFMNDLAPSYVVYSLFTPYPDAPIFEQGVKKGLWKSDVWDKFMVEPTEDHDLPTAWEEHLDKEELLQLFKQVNRRFYFNPRTLLRTALAMRSFAEIKRVFLGGISLIRMEFLKVSKKLI